MAQFAVKSRKTSALALETVEAETREAAIQQLVEATAEGEEIEILDVEELPSDAGGGGETGGTGATGATGA